MHLLQNMKKFTIFKFTMYKNTYFVDIAVKASTKFNIYLLTLSRPVISKNGKDDKLQLENITWHILPPYGGGWRFR